MGNCGARLMARLNPGGYYGLLFKEKANQKYSELLKQETEKLEDQKKILQKRLKAAQEQARVAENEGRKLVKRIGAREPDIMEEIDLQNLLEERDEQLQQVQDCAKELKFCNEQKRMVQKSQPAVDGVVSDQSVVELHDRLKKEREKWLKAMGAPKDRMEQDEKMYMVAKELEEKQQESDQVSPGREKFNEVLQGNAVSLKGRALMQAFGKPTTVPQTSVRGAPLDPLEPIETEAPEEEEEEKVRILLQ